MSNAILYGARHPAIKRREIAKAALLVVGAVDDRVQSLQRLVDGARRTSESRELELCLVATQKVVKTMAGYSKH